MAGEDSFQKADPDLLDDPCSETEDENTETCGDEEDICVKYNLAQAFEGNEVKLTSYSCGKDSEDNVSGESPHCKSEREERESEGFTDFTCETVITVDKDGIPVENGGENTQLKFIMAVAVAVLYGVL